MSDHNDFFDDMIDVDDDAESDATQYFEDEGADDEDEDEGAVVRTAVLSKNGMFALLSLRAGEDGGRIERFDPREPLPSMRRYDTEGEAHKWFGRSLATSRRNGWAIVYDGVPLAG